MKCDTEHEQNKSYTEKHQNHTPTGFQLIVVDADKNIVKNVIYRGKQCMKVFCKKISDIEKFTMDIMDKSSSWTHIIQV